MKRRIILVGIGLAFFAGFLVFGPSAAPAANQKVQICHIPPDNPNNFHTIRVSERALAAHLAHGDIGGSCDAHCEELCDDGDACNIDDCDPAGGCVEPRPPVDCDDTNLCTTDSCDPATGCVNDPVVCEPPDLCTVSMCAPDTGACVDSPVSCPTGEACNLATGDCEVLAKLVFVTSETYTGNLGGLAGADNKCQTLAEAAHLPGTYKAWLSDRTASPSTRFVKHEVPYQLVDGTRIADSWTDLVDGSNDPVTVLQAPINLTESGGPAPLGTTDCIVPPRPAAWTDTFANGERVTLNNLDSCDDWSVGTFDGTLTHAGECVGDTEITTDGWSCRTTVIFCDCRSPLYCFQQ